MAIYDYSPTKVELQSHIQFFSGGRCNVTLGGGRSILLSYRRKFNFQMLAGDKRHYSPFIMPQPFGNVNHPPEIPRRPATATSPKIPPRALQLYNGFAIMK